MKKPLLVILTLLAVGVAVAQTPPPDSGPKPQGGQKQGQRFDQRKQEILQHLQTRVQITQAAISCVQTATNHEALRSCREEERKQMQSLRTRR
jgi:hypothetical protein